MLRAFALASDTSDVVGTLDLDCHSDGLQLRFVRVRPYGTSLAPLPPTRNHQSLVPYAAVRRIWDDGEALRIELDCPELPYKKLTLTHVTRNGFMDHTQVRRWRSLGQWAVVLAAALVLGAWVAWVSALAPAWSTLLTMIGAGVVGGGSVRVTQALSRWALVGGNSSSMDRRTFFNELRHHVPAEVDVRDDEQLTLPSWPLLSEPIASAASEDDSHNRDSLPERVGSRVPWLVTAGATAFVLVLALLTQITSRSSATSTAATWPSVESTAGVRDDLTPPPLLSTTPREPAEETTFSETCLCQSPASSVLPTRVPKLTLLPTVKRLSRNPKRPSLDLELAVVNNSGESIQDLTGSVAFFKPARREGQPLQFVREQGLLYEGTLAGGSAIKWRLKSRGTEYQLHVDDRGVVDENELASPDAFAKLLSAHTRGVRLHGAAMLARMRDERAHHAIELLREAASEEETAFLDALARAAAPVYVCNLHIEPHHDGLHTSVCIMNTGDESATGLAARLLLQQETARTPVSTGEPLAPLVNEVLADRFRISAKTGVVVRRTLKALPPLGDKDLVADVVVSR